MHLLIGAKPGLLNTFFSLVKKRLCSPGPKHCLNVEAVVLCTLGKEQLRDSYSGHHTPLGHHTDRSPMSLGQYGGLGEYCGPHTACFVFLLSIPALSANQIAML